VAPDGNPALLPLILREVRARGRITFERYMELALYHPRHGYYSSDTPRVGPEGDYYTSSDVSPLFGAAIGRQLLQMWELLDRPRPFTVVEWGAGKGMLAADILSWARAARPDFYEGLEYALVELGPGLRRWGRERLAGLPVRWLDAGDLAPGSVTGCVLSNEVADALPFHRVTVRGGALQELWVVECDGSLDEAPGDPSTPRLVGRLERGGVRLEEGQVAEVSLRAGWALTVDYGGRAGELYAAGRREGTLACYHRHTLNREPFRRVGEQDITAHVDFSALARAARDGGAQVAGYTTQAYFLAGLGLGEALAGATARATSTREYERERVAVERLINPDGLGAFRVLLARKHAPDAPLSGLSLLNEDL
jgi:SAM-dependent MidA family methyltransferase